MESIVCLGVGSYGSSVSARYQLALALLLRETLLGVSAADAAPPPPTAGGGAALDVYDPVLSEAEVAFARARGCGLPARNEEGRRPVEVLRTLFFMPHCGRQLYANVVAANWGGEALGRVLILGNSFAAYADALTDAQTADAARWCACARDAVCDGGGVRRARRRRRRLSQRVQLALPAHVCAAAAAAARRRSVGRAVCRPASRGVAAMRAARAHPRGRRPGRARRRHVV